ncbi:RING finger protein 24 isoform X2 [Micropterus salmoides]|uniref:RING finger protein 24 isoform X2 n=1 Tax=Micropterus salmoides TaxID=27706 RepID=UPI0018EB9E10|nr:RING finger protein 24 isoform X2 [Micropterus salmoides]XP_038569227.1 RING finger protein 24 isoform X2 [Micropterus salmoides]XP_038569228.1 RING finger protein 24 isoform X2 [Micropterus salmoides]
MFVIFLSFSRMYEYFVSLFNVARWRWSPTNQKDVLSLRLPRLRHQAHKELYAYKQVIQKEKVKELNLHEICAVCLEEFKQKDELGICPCKHAFHRKCLIKWLEVRKVCPLCNMPVLQLAQQAGSMDPPVPIQQPLPGIENLV